MAVSDPQRGEIWIVTFREAIGQEIRKTRPALVINMPKYGRKELRIVVPITTGHENYANLAWMISVKADSANSLDHDSYADASQVQPASMKRFVNKLGTVQDSKVMNQIAAAVALCVGHSNKQSRGRRK